MFPESWKSLLSPLARPKRLSSRLLTSMLLILLAVPVFAQSGNVSGVVKDGHHAVVKGALVTLTDVRTHHSRKATTGADGVYAFQGVPEAVYQLTFDAAGFQAQTLAEVKVPAAGAQLPEVVLAVASTSEKTTVYGNLDLLTPDTAPVQSPLAIPLSSRLSSETITREDIEIQNPGSVYDLLAGATGMNVTFQGRKLFNFVNMRAGEGLGIVLDGYYLTQTQANRVLALLPVDAIESVTITRDATTLSLGPILEPTSTSGAPNQGFILITTRKGRRTEGKLSADIGNFGSYKAGAWAGFRSGRFRYFIAGGGQSFDGPKNAYATFTSGSVLLDAQYDGKHLKGNVTAYFDSAMRDFQRSLPGTSSYTQAWSYDPLRSAFVAADLNWKWNEHQITSFSASHGQVTDDFHGLNFGSTYKPCVWGTSASTTATCYREGEYENNYQLWHTAIFGNLMVKSGFQALLWDNPTGVASWAKTWREEDIFSGYVQGEYKVNNRLTVDGGFRVDTDYILHDSVHVGSTTNPAPLINHTWTSPTYGMTVGANYKLTPVYALALRFGYSDAAIDPFLPSYNNAVLDPEKRLKYEGGVQAKYRNWFQPKLNYYYYDIGNFKYSNWTNTVKVGGVNYTYSLYAQTNVFRSGLEGSVEGKFKNGLGYQANYAWEHSTYWTVDIGIPQHIFTAQLNHRSRLFDASTSFRTVSTYYSKGFYTDGKYHAIGDYTSWNADLGYRFKVYDRPLKVSGYARNLLDSHYQTTAGYADLGRIVGGKLEIPFGGEKAAEKKADKQ